MIYTVYIDTVFFVNILMDAVVLTILNRVLCYRTSRRRLWAGAAIGSLWACIVSLCPGMPVILQAVLTYVVISSLMAAAAFPLKTLQDMIWSVAGIYLVSVVLGGMMVMLYENTSSWGLMAAGAVTACYGFSGGILRMIGTMAQRRDLCQVTLWYGDRKEQVTGLIDTGNRLREPASGRPVHVAGEKLMRRLCPVVKGVVYVPYQSVGNQGLLPAVAIDRMEVGQQGRHFCVDKPLIAIAKQPVSPLGEYEILIQKADSESR